MHPDKLISSYKILIICKKVSLTLQGITRILTWNGILEACIEGIAEEEGLA